MPNLASEARSILTTLHLNPRKNLGQNFMVSDAALLAIQKEVSADSKEAVLEIGPGLGFLTRVLLQQSEKVIAIEKDHAFAEYLKKKFGVDNLQVIEQDVLKVNLKKDLQLEKPITVAGNIPYNITSPILEWLIEQREQVSRAVLTMQWEVAERLMAPPGGKTWGPLSIFVQSHATITLVQRVGKDQFWPAPEVDSAVIRLDWHKKALYPENLEKIFFETVRTAFQKRRKMLSNALYDKNKLLFTKEVIAQAIHRAGLVPTQRPETLSIEEWATLVSILALG